MSYETAKKRAATYNKIVGELPRMRKETVTLIKQAVGENRRAYVLVNNPFGRECTAYSDGFGEGIGLEPCASDGGARSRPSDNEV